MAKGWKLRLIRPVDAIELAVNKAWAIALQDLEQWMRKKLVPAMVTGGFGVQGISETPFYRFISSPEGLSQLGIEKADPPKLLDAYRKTFKVSRNNKLLMLKFGDVARLKLATPHPAAGTGNLHVQSWMEFIVDGTEAKSGFVPRNELPDNVQKNIRIRSAPGGLMLPRGAFSSTGLWRFPSQLQKYETIWFQGNAAKIEKAIINAAVEFLTKRMS